MYLALRELVFSKRIDNVIPYSSLDSNIIDKCCTNKEELIKIILFDHIIYNKDRSFGNVLFSIKQKILEYNKYLYDIIVNVYNCNLTNLYQLSNDFRSILNYVFFSEIVEEIPSKIGITQCEKNIIVEYLTYRLKNLDCMCKQISDYFL